MQSVNSSEAKNMRAIAKFAAALPMAAYCAGLMTEIKDRRYGKRSGLQNQCAVPDMIDLSSIYPCCLRRKFTSIRIPRGRCRDAGKDDK